MYPNKIFELNNYNTTYLLESPGRFEEIIWFHSTHHLLQNVKFHSISNFRFHSLKFLHFVFGSEYTKNNNTSTIHKFSPIDQCCPDAPRSCWHTMYFVLRGSRKARSVPINCIHSYRFHLTFPSFLCQINKFVPYTKLAIQWKATYLK